MHRARDEKFFKGEKIITLRKCVSEPKFTYADFDCYVSASFYVIKTERINQKYLTAFLNSRLIKFWLRHKGKMQGNNFQVDKEPLLNIPILKPSDTSEFESFVSEILNLKTENKSTTHLEKKIDELIYQLYDLTEDEVSIIENT